MNKKGLVTQHLKGWAEKQDFANR